MISVLIDLSYLGYRAMHAVGDLSHDDIPTGVLFGFFSQLRQIAYHEQIRSVNFHIFSDSRRSLRKEEFPGYKTSRTKDRTEDEITRIRAMRKQVDLLKSVILPAIGFPVYEQDGLESDDLLAWAARKISVDSLLQGKRGRQAVIVTGDSDLYQCVTPRVHWFDPTRNLYLNPREVRLKTGCTPLEYREAKVMSGCSTDTVPGIPGIGLKSAISYLHGLMPSTYKKFQSIQGGGAVIERNERLIGLPRPETKRFRLRTPRYDVDEFMVHCKRYGLSTFIENRDSWESFFAGTAFRTIRRKSRD